MNLGWNIAPEHVRFGDLPVRKWMYNATSPTFRLGNSEFRVGWKLTDTNNLETPIFPSQFSSFPITAKQDISSEQDPLSFGKQIDQLHNIWN